VRFADVGPDILARPPELDRIAANLRSEPRRAVGEALLDQRLVAGIGNVWKGRSAL
jgi:endonuclease-8